MSPVRSYRLNRFCLRGETRQHRVYWSVGVAVTAGLLMLCLPLGPVSQAVASCGDWLAHPVTTSGDAASERVMSGQAVPENVQLRRWGRSLGERPAGGDRWPDSPCQGGRCEQAPVPPMPPVPVRMGGVEHQFVDARARRDAPFDSASLLLALEDSGAALPGFPYRIRRPPKI